MWYNTTTQAMETALETFTKHFAPPGWKTGGGVSIPSLTGAADAFLAVALATKPRAVLAVVAGIPDSDRLLADLNLLAPSVPRKRGRGQLRVLEFPLPSDGDRAAFSLRLKTAAALGAWELSPYPCVVVAPAAAVAAPLPAHAPEPLRVAAGGGRGSAVSFNDFAARLAALGYSRVPQVAQEGDYSVRGGIIDAWSPGEELPVRAEFFGDELEGLRSFSSATQVSVGGVDQAEFMPIENGLPDADGGGTLLERMPEGSVVLALEHNEYRLPEAKRDRLSFVFTGDPAPRGVPTYDFQTVPLPGFAELGADAARHPELFEQSRARLERHLEASERLGAQVVRIDDLSGGFELPGAKGGKAVLAVSKADRVFARRRAAPPRRGLAASTGARISDFDELEPGEYVVHVDYGVGRYIGSSEITVNGRRSEVFTVEYADGGKLHVPAAHAHLLSRYIGVRGEEVRLHRLDGRRWEKDRLNAQKAVTDLAAALLETQARRATTPGFAYDVACDGLDAFEAAFPYEETPDQAEAIEAVKRDLASTKPMDRLVCGDAGYGKTEVAMRAAYIAAMNGKQVAVLAPTTVLAEQHFETFSSRFDGTPIRIESVSRFQGEETRRGTFNRLAAGTCDIVIGTHALLTGRTMFRDLGLIVIDEEQRFGVRHKEFLKRLRATADVLTLSATPIPRTLYLSMTGARDLSLLRSPPRERVAVVTKVKRDSDAAIAAAIAAELARGGQVYYLHNRISTIHLAERRIRAVAPKARVVVAHGRMDARSLAAKMRDFERGLYDVLLSTTIVESGLDIPRANTIIVDRADTFGLADLYQLRGRVGRSSRQGYAYLMIPASGDIDSDARERLAALRRHGGLGAGFNLAVRDLELRGAGNLLGSQQSGHIAAVGFGLYCQLLKRTIALMKGEQAKETVDVKLNLDFVQPHLPYEYIEDDSQRLELIRRFAEAQDIRSVTALALEMKDRFGPPPRDADEFVAVSALRVRCARAGISDLDVKDERAVFYRAGSREIAFVEFLKGKTFKAKIAELNRALVTSAR